jgi:hypothetical protein
MVQMGLKQLVKVGMIILTSTLLLPPQALEAKGDSSPASRSNSACRLISAKQMHQLFGGEWAEPTPTSVKDLDPDNIAGCQISTKHPYGTASFLDVYISTKAQRDKNGNPNDLETSIDVAAGLFHSKPIAGVGDRAIGYWVDMEENLGNGVLVVAKGTTFVKAILTNQYHLKKANLSKLAELGKLMAPLLGS